MTDAHSQTVFPEENTQQQFTSAQQPQYTTSPTGPQPEQLVLEWKAPSRPFKKRHRRYYMTIATIVLLISLILFFSGQFLPIAVVIAVAFMAYVLSFVPPELVLNQLTTYGIRNDNTLYNWENMGRFWSETKLEQRIIHVELTRFPNQLTLLLGDQDEQEVVEIMSSVLLYERPPLTTFDKVSQWLQEKIPLDTEA